METSFSLQAIGAGVNNLNPVERNTATNQPAPQAALPDASASDRPDTIIDVCDMPAESIHPLSMKAGFVPFGELLSTRLHEAIPAYACAVFVRGLAGLVATYETE